MQEVNESIINKLKSCDLYRVPEGWIIDYPEFEKLADEQMDTFWPWSEPLVENDTQDLRVRLTEQELHGITTVLKLFTIYEMRVGDDYWLNRIARTFKRPELQRMATMFSCVEFNSHAKFYNKVNEVLFLDTEEFYSEWKHNEDLSKRIEFISKCVKDKNDLLSIGAFSFIEGAVLYSSFAFIKHFQSQACGKDLLKNVCSGVNLSVADENTHAVGGALLFNTLVREANLTQKELTFLKESMESVAQDVYNHESAIIDLIFEKGEIKGITKEQMKEFVKHRCNLCLQQLNFDPVFEEQEGYGIKDWFYKDINSVAIHDFFSAGGNEYNIKWKEVKFGSVWE